MLSTQFALTSLSLAGWKFETPKPTEKKYVALAVPHTSNWDGLLLLLNAASIGLKMRWMVKDSVTKGPLGPLALSLGAVPIDRSQKTNLVDQMVDKFKREEEFVLFIPPEGTRSLRDHWKSGFYHIACGADVPVLPGYLDFGRKRAGIGPAIRMTGNVRADMDKIRAFYAQQNPIPRHPELFGPIKLREE